MALPDQPSLRAATGNQRADGSAGPEEAAPDRAWMAHVYAAFALAVAAPLYGRLEHQPRYLAGQETATILVFAVLWTLVAPGALILVIFAARKWNARAGLFALKVTIGICFALLFLAVCGRLVTAFSRSDLDHNPNGIGWLILLSSLPAGYFATRVYLRRPWLQSLLSVAALGSVFFPISLIWVFSQVSARPRIQQTLSAGNPVPVVLVVFDCLCGMSLMDQDRQVDSDRYPRFAELAATANWYRNCTAVHPRTDQAVPAILSGEWPQGYRAPVLQQYPQNLFTILQATGKYDFTSFEPFTRLCPPDRLRDRSPPDPRIQWIRLTATVGAVFLRDIVPRDLPIEPPATPREWLGLDHELIPDRRQRRGVVRYAWDVGRETQFQHFLNCITPTDGPKLWFGHFALPHFPWCYLPSGNSYTPDVGAGKTWGAEGTKFEDWVNDDLAVVHAHQQHLLQLGYTDRLLGQLIDHLKEVNLFDRCLLIVVADHGVSFRAGLSGRLPSETNLADIMSVPLFVKSPAQTAGEAIDLSVETTDVLPTILDVLNVTPPAPLPGQSVLAQSFSERPVKVFSNEGRQVVVDSSFEARYDSLVQQLNRFGTGQDSLRFFRIGPHSELIGQPVPEKFSDVPGIPIHPVNFAASVKREPGGLVPVHLTGLVEMTEAQQGPIRLAIAVNETVWGTTETYRVEYLKQYWRVMLPESAFRPGLNSIRVFQILELPDGPALAECSLGDQRPGPELPGD